MALSSYHCFKFYKFISLVFTRRLKTIKTAKIESGKGDRVNHLVCMLGDELISHLIAFKRKKGNRKYQKILILAIVDKEFRFTPCWEFFLLKLEKNFVMRRFLIMFYTCLFGNVKPSPENVMKTLFNQTRKYYIQNNKIHHLPSHMAVQAAPLSLKLLHCIVAPNVRP